MIVSSSTLVSLALLLDAVQKFGKIVFAVYLRGDRSPKATAGGFTASRLVLRRRRGVAPATLVEPCRWMLGAARIIPAALRGVAHRALQDLLERGLPQRADMGLHGVGPCDFFGVEAPEVVKALRSSLRGSSGRESVVKIVIRAIVIRALSEHADSIGDSRRC